MTTTNNTAENKKLFTTDHINKLANMLLNAGFDIIQYKPESEYFHYHKSGNIGYFQYQRIGGYTISTVNRPNKNTGTGFRILELGKDTENFKPTIKDFETGFNFAPIWAKETDKQSIVKYKSLEDFLKREIILKKTVIRANK